MAAVSPTLSPDDIDDLIYACRTNDLDSLRELLEHWSKQLNKNEAEIIRGAIDIDEDGNGSKACLLHYPAANGSLKLVKYILEKVTGGEITQINGDSSTNPTRSAANFVNHKNESGNTPLHWAALNGHLEVVQELVKVGADPTIVNSAGRDAVVEAEYSAKEKAEECAQWLLKECEALEKGAGSGGHGGAGQAVNGHDHEDEEDTTVRLTHEDLAKEDER